MKYFICLTCGKVYTEGTWEEEKRELREIRYVVGDKTYKFTEKAIMYFKKLYDTYSGSNVCPECFGILKELPKKTLKERKTFEINEYVAKMSERMGLLEEVKNEV